ncbi:MAG: DUF1648 domain-containing protein [Bacteroidetes bacterium]|nr:DUF1648 domain-containing protein [Bacteroidota bacterium]
MVQKKSFGKQNTADRPRIRPEKEPLDFLLEIASLITVVAMVVVTAWKYHGLPQQIPTHFNGSGLPDDYSSKGMIWLLPVIAVVIFTGISILNRFPFVFNFPVNITPENAERMYRHASRSIRILNLLLVITFFYLTWKSIAVAMGSAAGLGLWFLPVSVGAIFLFTLYMVIRMYRLK